MESSGQGIERCVPIEFAPTEPKVGELHHMTLVHETEPEVEEGELKQNRDAEDQDNRESGTIGFRSLLHTLRSIQWQKASAKGDDFA